MEMKRQPEPLVAAASLPWLPADRNPERIHGRLALMIRSARPTDPDETISIEEAVEEVAVMPELVAGYGFHNAAILSLCPVFVNEQGPALVAGAPSSSLWSAPGLLRPT